MSDFKVGDVIELIPGGLTMTVIDNANGLETAWFFQDQFHSFTGVIDLRLINTIRTNERVSFEGQPGDWVYLQSGGRHMFINRFDSANPDQVYCLFTTEQGGLIEKAFPVQALTKNHP